MILMKDAIIYLEKKGKVEAPEVTDYTTEQAQQTSTEFEQAQQEYTRDCNKKTFGQMMDQFFSWCGRLLKKSVDSKFIIERRGSTMVNVPVLVLILAIIFAFWITIPLLVVGLFCECRYHFAGIDNIKNGISMCIFPEGTRNKTEDLMLPFKEGSFKMAEKTGCLIVPMAISGSADILEAHFPKVKPVHVIVEYGKPIDPKSLDKDTRKKIGSHCQGVIAEMLEKNNPQI